MKQQEKTHISKTGKPAKSRRKTPPNRHGWTPERRAAQAERIRRVKPWRKSTGPRTEDGKEAVKNNACRHGWRSEDMREVYRLLRCQRQFVKRMCEKLIPRRHDGGRARGDVKGEGEA